MWLILCGTLYLNHDIYMLHIRYWTDDKCEKAKDDPKFVEPSVPSLASSLWRFTIFPIRSGSNTILYFNFS